MALEYLERLGLEPRGERWLARDGDALVNVLVYDDEPEGMHDATLPWVGWRHGRVVTIRTIARSPRLTIVTGDERGPQFYRAASAWPAGDPDRETWCVSEIIELAQAIDEMAAHQPGFIHRRAHNDNVVVGADGRARLRAPIAFSSVGPMPTSSSDERIYTMTGARWLAPEQVRSWAVTPATDVFQLAATLHAALTGRMPASGGTQIDLLEAIAEHAPPPPPVTSDARLAGVIVRALARSPAERFPTPAAFADALLACSLPGDSDRARAKVAEHAVHEPAAPTSSRCRGIWEQLRATQDPQVRYCDVCQLDVIHLTSVDSTVPLLGKLCCFPAPKPTS